MKATCSEIVYRVNPDTLRREQVTALQLNEIGRVRLTLFQPLFVDEYRNNRATATTYPATSRPSLSIPKRPF